MTVSTHKVAHALAIAVLLACVAVVATGCSSTQAAQRPLDTTFIVPGKTTKEEIYQGLGLPDTLFFPGYPVKDRKWYYRAPPMPNLNTVGDGKEVAAALVYAPNHGVGMGVGIGTMGGTLFFMGHHHAAGATLLVLMDADDRVLGTHVLATGDYIERRLWPF